MKHVIQNGYCVVYHTRSFTKPSPTASDPIRVHVLEFNLLTKDMKTTKRNRVRVQVRFLWPNFHIEKIEKVDPEEGTDRDQLIFQIGGYLDFFQRNIYRYFKEETGESLS